MITRASLLVRLSVIPLALLAILLVPHPAGGLVVLAIAGTMLAVALPATAGALVLMAALVLAWVSSYGTDTTTPVARTVLFAAALYLVHAAVALAASVPAAASVPIEVVRAWVARCWPGLVAAVAAGAVISLIGQTHGSLALDVVGVGGALVTAGAAVWLVRRTAG